MKKILLAVMLTVTASAGFLVEPIIGYRMADVEQGSDEYEYKGLNLGARLGYTLAMAQFGLSYDMGSYELESTNATPATKTDYKSDNLGVFAGVSLPMVRIWGSYFFASNLERDEGLLKGLTYTGNGMGIGAGYTGLPFVSINLEYRSFEYDEWEDSPGAAKSGKLTNKIKASEIMFSVSAPFDLL